MTRPRQMPLAAYIATLQLTKVKLNLGCGGERLEGFINIDMYPELPGTIDSSRNGCKADIVADMTDLGLPDSSVDEIFTAHTLEHFPRWIGERMLRDWHRMLKPGGTLHVETPDFWRCVLWLFHPRKRNRILGRNMFYGNQTDQLEYETHRYVWSARELRDLLCRVGFGSVVVDHRTSTHHPGRDMRAVARR